MQKIDSRKLVLAGAMAGLLMILNPVVAFAQISIITSDRTMVKDGDTIAPIGFQGILLITSPEYRAITITNPGKSIVINSITIEGDPDFSINSADSGLNLWEKKPLVINNRTLDAGKSFDFHLSYCPLSGGDRKAVITITYDTSKTFKFTVKGRGRPEEIKQFSNGSEIMHKIWGGFNKNQDERPAGMVVDSLGNIYFTGNGKYISSDTFYYDLFIVKINADRTLGWQMVYHSKYNDRFPDPGQNDESGGSAASICMDEKGFIYIAASVGNGSNSAYLTMIMKINPADGSQVWKKYWFANTERLKFTDSSEAYAIAVSEGMVFITGEGSDFISSTQGLFVAAFDAVDGSHKWSRIINPNSNKYKDRGYTIKGDGRGSLLIAGWQGENTGSPFLCKLTDIKSAPALSWAVNFSMGTGSNFNAMDIDAGGNIYLSADRRGATTFFSIIKVSPDGKQITGRTFPGTAGGNNNTKVVRVVGDYVYVGGRIGISGLDTGQGDGMLFKLKSLDLSLQWAAVYFTGTGPKEVCEHHLKGIEFVNNELYLYGEVYTGNNNYFRYYGYWFDLPGSLEDYKPQSADVTSATVMLALTKAGLVDGSTNGGVYETLSPDTNVEYQDATAKNETTHGSQVDSDVFIMKLKL
ncbi:MAG: hypothetical protein EHM28_00835 [Spirochaetaceae bacterium]|nr:MAG: hypothetical protein EHM28_00835 [Spirochaetaceae bacterium]